MVPLNTRFFFFILEEAKETVFELFVNTILLNTKYILIFINIKIIQNNSLNVNLSNSQLNKFKSAIKNENEVALRLSSNMIGDNETNFPHKLLLTNKQVSNLRKAFADHLSADIKLSKTRSSKMIQSGGFLGKLLDPLLKPRLPLIKNVIKPLAKVY